jgi:hypothetical protein
MVSLFVLHAAAVAAAAVAAGPPFYVLDPAAFAPLLGSDHAWAVGPAGPPLFEASDANLTTAYIFRFRVLKSHIHNNTGTDDPGLQYVITEFSPNVPWAGRANTIPCAAGHHLTDARWLRSTAVAESYSRWWVSGLQGVRPNYYSFWATAVRRRLQVEGAAALPLISVLLPNASAMLDLFGNGTHPPGSAFSANHDCMFNVPGNEGQERTISGPGCRPLVQALLFGEADALSELCAAAGDAACASRWAAAAAQWRARVLVLWNPALASFDTLRLRNASDPGGAFSGVRELGSLSSPWFFGAVPPDAAAAYGPGWAAAFDPQGFLGPFGLRTAEARHPEYKCPLPGCSGGCYWSGPVWPFETSKLLRAGVDVLQSPLLAPAVPQLSRAGWWQLMGQYTAMHAAGVWKITNYTKAAPNATADPAALARDGFLLDGLGAAWVGELGCAEDGAWTDDPAKGFLYEHSTYADLVLSGVAGLAPAAWAPGRPAPPPSLTVAPLQPADGALAWWCADGVRVGGRVVTVLWDADGSRYGRGAGLRVLVDGVQQAAAATTQGPPLVVAL